MSSTFRIKIGIPTRLRFETGGYLDRKEFFKWLWNKLPAFGLLGVHEGTVLSEQAADLGLETESFTVDAGEAPRERDWVQELDLVPAELYFPDRESAKKAARKLTVFDNLEIANAEEVEDQDWNEQWKASFTGIDVPPYWRVLPPHMKNAAGVDSEDSDAGQVLWINPGAGFGTGTHETTQGCLEVLGRFGEEGFLKKGDWVLDFGSGSGILALAAAKLGAEVDAVEIDSLAVDNSVENAKLNLLLDRVHHTQKLEDTSLPQTSRYRVVLANILAPVLLEFSEKLVSRLSREGALILSGMMAPDSEPVIAKYSAHLGKKPSEILTKGEWRAVVWKLS